MADDKRRTQKNESQNNIQAAKRDIGDPPAMPVGELAAIRAECDSSLQTFLETCFPEAFRLAWSDDHLRLIKEIQRIGISGGLKAIAMPRGSGKSTILVRAALWLILTGRRRFCVVIAATASKAKDVLKSLKTILLHSKRLAKLYPQELHAIRSLRGEGKKALQQTSNGVLTGVEWNTEKVNFGFVEDSAMRGSGISVTGITSGNIRGQELTLPSGEVLRPDICVIDDPTTKKASSSQSQTQERQEIVMGDCLGMAGPDRTISAFCSCTCVEDDDLPSRLLDRDKHPEWQGEKCQMVYEWPEDESLWEQYRDIRHDELRQGGDGSRANQFVVENYDAMHIGARVGWEARKGSADGDDSGIACVSALQHAYDLRFQDEHAFYAEYQNEPLGSVAQKVFNLKPDDIAARVGSDPRNVVPVGCEKLTAFVDVQQTALFYLIVAWTMKGRGHVIDYGTCPDQKRSHFTKRQINRTLQKHFRSEVLTDVVYAGLEELTGDLLTKVYQRTDGAELQIDRLGIDARWGRVTRIIRRFCRENEHRAKTLPMMGYYIGKNNLAWSQWTHRKGTRLGIHYRLQPPPEGQPGSREIMADSNWWKSWVAERLSTIKGSDKSILLFRAAPSAHRMIAEHWTSEDAVEGESKSGGMVTEWKQSHSGIDNEYWDCLYNCAVLAHLEGVPIEDGAPKAPPVRRAKRKYGVYTQQW